MNRDAKLDKTQAPVSPHGWEIVEHFYNGDPRRRHHPGCSLAYAKEYHANWKASLVFDSTRSELLVRPAQGWESVRGNKYLALAHLIAERLLSPEMGAVQIQGMVEKGETSVS